MRVARSHLTNKALATPAPRARTSTATFETYGTTRFVVGNGSGKSASGAHTRKLALPTHVGSADASSTPADANANADADACICACACACAVDANRASIVTLRALRTARARAPASVRPSRAVAFATSRIAA